MLLSYDDIYCGVYDSSIIRKKDIKSMPRIVTCYELELFHRDTGASYIDGIKNSCKKGMLLCAKPGQIRFSEFPVRCSFIRFFPTGRDKDAEMLVSSFPDICYIEDEARIERLMSLFTKLAAAIVSNRTDLGIKSRINSMFYDILYRIKLICDNENEVSGIAPMSRIVGDAYEYINENYTQDCSLEKIAEAVCASPNHIHTVFKQSLGMTPYEYVLKKRIEKSENLIMSGELSMLEVALESGFCSQSHFNKMFKAQTGQTPIEYRKKLLEHY